MLAAIWTSFCTGYVTGSISGVVITFAVLAWRAFVNTESSEDGESTDDE